MQPTLLSGGSAEFQQEAVYASTFRAYESVSRSAWLQRPAVILDGSMGRQLSLLGLPEDALFKASDIGKRGQSLSALSAASL